MITRFSGSGTRRINYGAPDRRAVVPYVSEAMPRRPQLNGLPVLKNRGGTLSGRAWTLIPTIAGAGSNGIASKNGVTLYLAGGQTVPIRRTTDFINFTSPTGLATDIGFVAQADYSPSLNMWLVPFSLDVPSNRYATSTDNGATWTMRTFPYGSPNRWFCVAWLARAGLWIAGGDANSGTTSYATSTDGISWTTRTLPSAGRMNAVVDNGSLYFLQGDAGAAGAGETEHYTSTDAINWTSRSGGYGRDVIWDGARWVVLRNGTELFFSADAINWTQRTLPMNTCGALAYGNGTYVVARQVGTAVPYYLVSTDLTNWTEITPSFAGSFSQGLSETQSKRLVWDADKKLFISVGNNKFAYSP